MTISTESAWIATVLQHLLDSCTSLDARLQTGLLQCIAQVLFCLSESHNPWLQNIMYISVSTKAQQPNPETSNDWDFCSQSLTSGTPVMKMLTHSGTLLNYVT